MQLDSILVRRPPEETGVLPRANRVISIPDFQLDGRLTAEHVDFFETYGFIRFRGFVPRARAQALYGGLREITDDLVR